jgi:hypothetical protein
VDTAVPDPHECAPERRVDFQMFHLREEVAALESRITAYLGSNHGRFEAWLAARQVRRR